MRRLCSAFIVLCIWCLGSILPAIALAPDVDIHQLQHTRWTIGDGAPPDIWALAQGPDGFLWLATGAGLYRFDGVTFERIQPTDGKPFPSLDMTAVAVSPKGEIWIGYYATGVSEIVDGKLKNFGQVRGVPISGVFRIAIDHDGDTWVASQTGLFRFHDGRWDHIDQAWNYPYRHADELFVARDGTIWVAAPILRYLKPGKKKFQSAGVSLAPYARVSEDSAGRVWLADRDLGVLPLDRAVKTSGQGTSGSDFIHAQAIMFDGDGVLWGTDADHGGLFRVRSPNDVRYPLLRSEVADWFREKDGLTSEIADPILEDSEGDVWVGTNLGLNRFRANTFVRAQGLASYSLDGFSIADDQHGNVLAADAHSLSRVTTSVPAQSIAILPVTIESLIVDHNGTIWLAAASREFHAETIGFMDRGNFRDVPLPAGAKGLPISILTEDPGRGLIVGIGLSQIDILRNGNWLPLGPGLPRLSYTVAYADSHDRIWVGYTEQALAVIDHGSSRVFAAKDGLAIGAVTAIGEFDGRIVIGGEQGLAEYDGQSLRSLSAKRFAGFSGITGIVESRDKAIWTNGILGIVRIPERELEKTLSDQRHRVDYRLFDYRDGVIGMAQQAVFQSTAVRGPDGTLWFVTNHGIVSVDPLHLSLNTRQPPVSVLSFTVDGQTRSPEDQTLPAGTKEVRINYTATSLQVPERVQFRYVLEGFSDRWTDPGQLRQAFFTNLPPGRYRFRVIAANNDGVWNTRGAAVSFEIPPTFLQSRVFMALCVVLGALALWVAYSLRLEQMAGRVRSRLEERIRERERIARELHDTLLQSVQGLVLRFYAAVERMQEDDPNRQDLRHTIERADHVILDARERVRLLRTTDNLGDLPAALREVGEELVEGRTTEFRVIAEGATRGLQPIVFEELMWVGREALINAFTHAHARHVVAEISYHWREVRLQVSDDGRGLPEDVIAEGGRTGHFGLMGIRERVKHIRGRLTLHSGAGSGTALTVVVPAAIAYNDSRRRWSFGIRRLFAGEIGL